MDDLKEEDFQTYLLDGQEVVLTGRVATKEVRNKTKKLFEIVPASMYYQIGEEDLREYSRWVMLDTLYVIESCEEIENENEKEI